MDIEKEQIKLRLIESQMMVLQYQHKEVSAVIAEFQRAQVQKSFDAAVDARDVPSGATKSADQFAGS